MADTELNDDGYVVFSNNKKMLFHRWVAKKKYGEDEIKGKDVHHVNSIKTDNRDENLILLSRKDHATLTQYNLCRKVVTDACFVSISLGLLLTYSSIFLPGRFQQAMSLAGILTLVVCFGTAAELRYNYFTHILKKSFVKKK